MSDPSREQIEQYLAEIGMAEALIERSLSVMNEIEGLLRGPVEHVFVNDHRDEEGNRHYGSMWLMAPEHISEIQGHFTEQMTFDVVPVKPGFTRIEISQEHFRLTDATAEDHARLAVKVNFSAPGSALSGSFKASAGNCVVLAGIAQGYLRSQLIEN
jgi:hypothetical protein